MKHKVKLVVALVLVCTLIIGVVSALAPGVDPDAMDLSDAIYYYAPDNADAEIPEGELVGSTAAANTPVLSILGIDVSCSDNIGIIGNTSTPLNLLVFGSELNEAADPLLSNYYYDWATYGYLGDYDEEAYASYEGWYSLISNAAKSGPTGAANDDYAIEITVNGLTKFCNPLFFYDPDILLGSSNTSYSVGLEYYKDSGYAPEGYNPLQVGGWSMSEDVMSDGTFVSTAAMANGVYLDSEKIAEYASDNKLEGRYGDVQACGATYANFAMGIYYYAQSLFATPVDEGGLIPINYCTNLTVSGEGETATYTIGEASTNRMTQYASGLGNLVTSGTDLTIDELKDTVSVVISSSLTAEQIKDLHNAKIKVISTLPETVYGTTMQAPDNILGVPYYFAVFYGDQLGLNVADVTAYFVHNIYHVKDEENNIQNLVRWMMEKVTADMDPELAQDIYTISDGYTDDVINNMIAAGASYYRSLEIPDYVWESVDYPVG